MKSLLLFLSTSVIFLFTACETDTTDQPAPEGTATPTVEEPASFASSDDFKEQLEIALDSYFQLSAALIETDSGTAAETAPVLAETMPEFVDQDLDENALAFYEEAYEVITTRAETISQLVDVEEQRYQFEYLSDSMIGLVEAFGPLSYTVYVQRCPMVRDGSADWLSRESGILNPYHGDRMLRCGSIVREI